MRKIRIISGGNGHNSRVEDAETGELLDGVVSVSWTCDAGGVATAVVTFVDVEADLMGEQAEPADHFPTLAVPANGVVVKGPLSAPLLLVPAAE